MCSAENCPNSQNFFSKLLPILLFRQQSLNIEAHGHKVQSLDIATFTVFKNLSKMNTVVQMARLSFQQIKIRLSLVHLEKNVVGKWKSQNADSLKETLAFSNFPSLNPPPFGCLLCTQSSTPSKKKP